MTVMVAVTPIARNFGANGLSFLTQCALACVQFRLACVECRLPFVCPRLPSIQRSPSFLKGFLRVGCPLRRARSVPCHAPRALFAWVVHDEPQLGRCAVAANHDKS